MKFLHDGQVLIPKIWNDTPWLRLGCTTKLYPTGAPQPMGPTNEALALLEMLGLNDIPLLRCWQKHTNRVVVAGERELASARKERFYAWPETDGVVCPVPGAVSVVYTADCVPVLLYDVRTRITAAVHSGWRGTISHIASNAVETMRGLGCRPEDLRAWIGPCAGGDRYEVSEELIEQFREVFSDAQAEGLHLSKGRLLNLPAIVAHQLRKSGLRQPNAVIYSGICTIERHKEFPSYRMRENDNEKARIISFIYADPFK